MVNENGVKEMRNNFPNQTAEQTVMRDVVTEQDIFRRMLREMASRAGKKMTAKKMAGCLRNLEKANARRMEKIRLRREAKEREGIA